MDEQKDLSSEFLDSNKEPITPDSSDEAIDAAADRICDKIIRDDILDKRLSDSEIDNILIHLKEKEIEEQIRSNKVIEGILKDIYGSIGYLREAMEQAI